MAFLGGCSKAAHNVSTEDIFLRLLISQHPALIFLVFEFVPGGADVDEAVGAVEGQRLYIAGPGRQPEPGADALDCVPQQHAADPAAMKMLLHVQRVDLDPAEILFLAARIQI